jgi:xylulokinase
MYLLGIDIGSSSVKASILNGETGEIAGTSYYPKNEMTIVAKRSGWAEQQPELWWENLKLAIL